MQSFTSYNNVCANMDDNAGSIYKNKVGRPRKYAQQWSSVTKRLYIEESTLIKLRLLKSQNTFSSKIPDKLP